ncbi:hypothetical protein HDU79_007546 [Rhizoclosmatium sp. JEL0117]|nr:hypothetical protein HDU79_007546 [Rhizoclosmatium sp. JEL0117]
MNTQPESEPRDRHASPASNLAFSWIGVTAPQTLARSGAESSGSPNFAFERIPGGADRCAHESTAPDFALPLPASVDSVPPFANAALPAIPTTDSIHSDDGNNFDNDEHSLPVSHLDSEDSNNRSSDSYSANDLGVIEINSSPATSTSSCDIDAIDGNFDDQNDLDMELDLLGSLDNVALAHGSTNAPQDIPTSVECITESYITKRRQTTANSIAEATSGSDKSESFLSEDASESDDDNNWFAKMAYYSSTNINILLPLDRFWRLVRIAGKMAIVSISIALVSKIIRYIISILKYGF